MVSPRLSDLEVGIATYLNAEAVGRKISLAGNLNRNPWHAQVYRDMSHIPRSPMCIDGLHNRKISGVQAANPPLERRERPNRPALGSVNYCRLPHDDDTYDMYTRQCAGRQYLYTAKLPPTSAADAMLGRSKSLHWELRAGAETACTL